MGELTQQCSTVAIRYRFVFKRAGGDSEPQLLYLPHKVIKLKVDVPPPKDDSDSPEPGEVLREEDVVFENDVEYLRSLDPKEWKKQDHYKVLGIPTLRYRATEDIIKTAYRKMVLMHHPDKRKAKSNGAEEIPSDDDYFTCITFAYETLGTPAKRRAYDSVDPEFEDELPSLADVKRDFYTVCGQCFELNSRWSEKRKVPKLGDKDATRDQVERFYSFWYDFKSWREYSYEDEEDKDKCSDRDERRYVDKLNKAERLRKKKEEMSRIRQLVDLAYNNDPRIAQFRQDDRDRKLAAKRAKQNAAQQRRDEEERLAREALARKEQAEAEERARIEAKRQEREAVKKVVKRERKALRDFCKTNNYFTGTGDDAASSSDQLKHITTIEYLCETMSALELEELNRNLRNDERGGGKGVFMAAVSKANETKLEAEKAAALSIAATATPQSNNMSYQDHVAAQVTRIATAARTPPEWHHDHVQLLIKAVNLFPAGTNQRWEVVATFLNQHGNVPTDRCTPFNAKMVLAKAKDLQNSDFSRSNLRDVNNREAFENFEKTKRSTVEIKDSEMSRNSPAAAKTTSTAKSKDAKEDLNKQTTTTVKETTTASRPMTNGNVTKEATPPPTAASTVWTAREQQLLEQALKTYDASTPERWDRIAEAIPNRSKKECMRRYKELVETIKAKRAAQQAVGK